MTPIPLPVAAARLPIAVADPDQEAEADEEAEADQEAVALIERLLGSRPQTVEDERMAVARSRGAERTRPG